MAINISKSSNIAKINKAIKTSANKMNNLVSINIPLENIEPNPINAQIYNMSSIDNLASSIKRLGGLLTPISVYEKEDGTYIISSGHRRYEAMKLLGEATIPAFVIGKNGEDDLQLEKLLESNMNVRDMTHLDIARSIWKYRDILEQKKKYGDGSVNDALSEIFGISVSQIKRYNATYKLIEPFKELLNTKGFPLYALDGIGVMDEETQRIIYDETVRLACESDITKPIVLKAVDTIKRRLNLKANRMENETKQASSEDGGQSYEVLNSAESVELSNSDTIKPTTTFNGRTPNMPNFSISKYDDDNIVSVYGEITNDNVYAENYADNDRFPTDESNNLISLTNEKLNPVRIRLEAIKNNLEKIEISEELSEEDKVDFLDLISEISSVTEKLKSKIS